MDGTEDDCCEGRLANLEDKRVEVENLEVVLFIPGKGARTIRHAVSAVFSELTIREGCG